MRDRIIEITPTLLLETELETEQETDSGDGNDGLPESSAIVEK